jgi:Putative prokaryotic signal transducing protein
MARNDEAIVTIAVFETEFEASLARGALESIGIQALVPGEAGGSIGGLYSGRLPGTVTELRVFESDRDRAIVELRRMQMRIVEPPRDDVSDR